MKELAFLVCSTGDRINWLHRLLYSLKKQRDLANWKIYGVLQCYSNLETLKNYFDDFIAVDSLLGCHSARVLGLKHFFADIYCNLDDDMVIHPTQKYNHIASLLVDKNIGFIAGSAFRRVEKRNICDSLLERPLLQTAGGLFYRKDIADLMLSFPDSDYYFDDVEWTLQAYLSGYSNYYYLGSWVEHNICSDGGRQAWIDSAKRVLPDKRYVTLQKSSQQFYRNNQVYHMPTKVTAEAEKIHKQLKTQLKAGL